jgi:hypothetical protein
MKLYCDGQLFGSLRNYTYATPWAEAQIDPVDPAAYRTLCQASYFLNEVIEEDWGDLSPAEEERVYDQRLADLGLAEADLSRFQDGQWAIREADQPDHEGPITLAECTSDGWVRWRW